MDHIRRSDRVRTRRTGLIDNVLRAPDGKYADTRRAAGIGRKRVIDVTARTAGQWHIVRNP